MAPLLLLAFIAIPIIEIALLIQVGGWLGLWPTVGLVILTAVVGTALLRHQGFAILRRAQENLAANQPPVAEVFDGICLVFSGALLLTPGFFTDTLGFLLLMPPVRAALRAWLAARMAAGQVHVFQSGPGGSRGTAPGGGPIIDGDFQEVPDPAHGPADPDTQSLPPRQDPPR
ncbi:MAG: FxsA family protein [Rhodobacterales bacterium]|nr:FxsA family protein [Rhodobacterales bacterium]